MKLKVTAKNVRQDGKAIDVGTILEIEGDTVPASLVGKVVDLDGMTAITNPAEDPIQQPVVDRDDLKKQADELGIEYAKNISTEKLKDLVDAKLAE